MKNRVMKRLAIAAALLVVSSFVLSGCMFAPDFTLSEKDEDLISEYGAHILLQADPMYARDLNVKETEETTTRSLPTTKPAEDSSEDSSSKGETSVKPEVALSVAMGLEGVDVSYSHYQISTAYPNEEADAMYRIMKEGYSVLALFFDITNNSDKDIQVDMIRKCDFSAIINSSLFISDIDTAVVSNALNMYEGTIKKGKSAETVLLFYIKPENAQEINKIGLKCVLASGETNRVTLE